MIEGAKIDSLIIDTGVLVEYLCDTFYGQAFDKHFLSNHDIKHYYMSPLVYTELLYIFCRRMGLEKAEALLATTLKHMIILEETKLKVEAASLKCRYGIALADCYSIAAGKLQQCPVLMKKEKELTTIDLSELPAHVLFIDDFL